MKTILLFISAFIISISLFSQEKTGCISGDCENGKGIFLFPNGDKYEGDFENSHLKGYGTYTDFRGNVYVGYFKDDKFNGLGKFMRNDGTKYIGEFVNGKRNGLGTQWYSETYKEKGKWENDRYIEPADFEDFVISESYDFCTEFLKVYNASANGFSEVKGSQVSEYITDSYYCTIKIKELSTVEINDKEGFSGVYYKGTKEEGLKKFEELNKTLLSCVVNSCCVFQNKFLNGVAEKKYEFIPVSVSSNCNSNLLQQKIVITCLIEKNLTEVILSIKKY
jgi:hypothetical protein